MGSYFDGMLLVLKSTVVGTFCHVSEPKINCFQSLSRVSRKAADFSMIELHEQNRASKRANEEAYLPEVVVRRRECLENDCS